MKKFICYILTGVLVLSIIACGEETEPTKNPTQAIEESKQETDTIEESTMPTETTVESETSAPTEE